MTNSIDRHKYIKILLCGIYVCVNLFLIYFHEPWRDEAQTWLIARDVPLWEIPGYMSYEGHPCLWHLIIVPFAKLSMPYFTQNLVSLIIMTISVVVLLNYSKLSLFLKTILIFSPVFTYYYPVIARSYCLIPLCLFATAVFFKNRKDHPVRYTLAIAFLIQTHVIMMFAAFLMCVCLLIEVVLDYIHNKERIDLIKSGFALSLPVISVVLFGCQMLDLEKNSAFQIKQLGIRELLISVESKSCDIFKMLCGINILAISVAIVLLLAFLLATRLYSRSREKWTVLVVVVGTIVLQILFYVMIYNFSEQRVLVMPYMIVWGIWILREYYEDVSIKILEAVFGVFLCMMLLHHIPVIWEEIERPYSGSKEAAEFIRENIPDDAILVSDNKPKCSAIMPYLNQKYYLYAGNGEMSSYTKWTQGVWDTIEYDQFVSWINSLNIGDREVWFISVCNSSLIDGIERISNDYELYFESSEPSIANENYRIYRLR